MNGCGQPKDETITGEDNQTQRRRENENMRALQSFPDANAPCRARLLPFLFEEISEPGALIGGEPAGLMRMVSQIERRDQS